MTGWHSIDTAPKDATIRIDIWAKRWIAKNDSWEYRRFYDVFWSMHQWVTEKGVGGFDGWYFTHWMPAPNPPD